ncbi:MAG: hypothetical protein J7L96_03320, partial [Bacteroidales bacterium]|nr:hypothetical protein [Bacteroidales bacterium]
MMDENFTLNKPQAASVMLNAKSKVDIWGRGTGKSFLVGWDINHVNRRMPRALISVTGQTFGQLLTRTLPSTFKFLETLGYIKDKNYVVGKRPPKHFLHPMEKLMKYDNVISFANGNAILMLSQDRIGSARGPNVDYEILDEALTINKDRYDQETSPTNRGNEEMWGPKSQTPRSLHHGFHYVSSMPHSATQKWLLAFSDYYDKEAGIKLLSIWNRVVKMQLELIPAYYDKDSKLFNQIWNETIRLRRQIAPLISNQGLCFTLANAFDNIENVGFSYILREYEKQTQLTFLVEIMNIFLDTIEDCYYHIDETKHVYFNATNDDFIRDMAENTDWDFKKLGSPDSRFDLDCNPNVPLEISPDWGSTICLFSIGQERTFDFVSKLAVETDNFINEFYTKPDTSKDVMINTLVDSFVDYYRYHSDKTVRYFRDRYGDSRKPNVKNSKSYNEQAIARLQSKGWTVIPEVHKGMEPPQHDKYLLWGNILIGTDPKFPRIRFNGNKCKYTLISMNNTQVIESEGKFKKNKKSERSKTILPEEATHFSDAVDKRIWTKYGQLLKT